MIAKANGWIDLALWLMALFFAAAIINFGIQATATISKTGHKRFIRFIGVISGIFFAVFGGITAAIGLGQFLQKGTETYNLSLDACPFVMLIILLAAIILKTANRK